MLSSLPSHHSRISLKTIALVAVVLMALMLSSCSSVKPRSSGRQGFFDRLGKSSPSLHEKHEKREKKSYPSMVHEDEEKDSPPVDPKITKITSRWGLPLKNAQLTSRFGPRGQDFHEGVDFRATVGTPVYSIAAGTVTYAGSKIRGYGRMVVIQHENGLASIYSHHSRILVKQGQKIKQGQRIALSGKSGRVTGPHLHFELRLFGAPRNPLIYIPTFASIKSDPALLAQGH